MRKRKRMGYVRDQQGCLDVRKSEGGTLADDESSKDVNVVRVGTAKTKGKYRVVTMQSAYVKRVLRPIHEHLYNYLSKFGWLVRGDVSSADFLRVLGGIKEGEDIISGDYESATDNIYLPAVQIIVEEVARAGGDLMTSEEREVLIGSFRNLKWRSQSGRLYDILRGSMMGNLVSFPVLCILNKVCYDLTCDIQFGGPERVLREEKKRAARFNGDDCVFTGDDAFFRKWVEVTGWFGLVVNTTKTGTSRRFGELNSTVFDFKHSRFVAKPYLSFLRKTSEPGEILTSTLEGIKHFSTSVQMWIVHVVMRYEIAVKGISANSIPHDRIVWLPNLLRKRWFRRAVEVGPVPEKKPRVFFYDSDKKKSKQECRKGVSLR
jgi:hypothetical protein